MPLAFIPNFYKWKKSESILKQWENPAPLKKCLKITVRKPPLDASKKTTIRAGFLKNLRNIFKTNWNLITEIGKPKTSCKYRETKKVKKVQWNSKFKT